MTYHEPSSMSLERELAELLSATDEGGALAPPGAPPQHQTAPRHDPRPGAATP
jgi:hypothetical protein